MFIPKPRWLLPRNGRTVPVRLSMTFPSGDFSESHTTLRLRTNATTQSQPADLRKTCQYRAFSRCSILTRSKVAPRGATSRPPVVRIGKRVAGRTNRGIFESAFSDLEIELRKSRPYDSFDMEAARFWEVYRDYENNIGNNVRRQLRNPSSHALNKDAFVLEKIFEISWTEEEIAKLLKIGFYNRIMTELFSVKELERQKALTDCRYPMDWFPRARLAKRVLHLHVGPTNSGKTYQALKRLESASLGCYAGPLRLLAQEIYARMNARGRPTWLVTGDDQQLPSIPYEKGFQHGITSCTVEMIDYNDLYDVAVIDEVQMAADKDRGHAWTSAIVGVQAKEVHLCGEERTVPLIQEIARSLGEELIVHRYKRLSPLAVADNPLGDMTRLQKGDCIVCFSVVRIHAMKRYVEQLTNKRVAIIYGSLPPEVRAQQARLFNEQDNDYDFLVASDAIGMGLNLAVSRIIFDTTRKRTKAGPVTLTTPEIRQIGGRAGRYRTAIQDSNAVATPDDGMNAASTPAPAQETTKIGMVTAFEREDLSNIRKSMDTDPEPITKFGVLPNNDMIELLCSYFPIGIPYSFILARVLEISQVSHRYFFCEMHDSIQIADYIQSVKNLSIAERIKVCFAPVSMSVSGHPELIKEMAQAIANQTGGDLLEIKRLNFKVLDEAIQSNREYLQRLEILHKGLVLYLWMSFRFPGVFIQRPLAIRAKMLVEENIDTCLTSMKYANLDKTRLREQKEKDHAIKEEAVMDTESTSPDDPDAEEAATSSSEQHSERRILHDLQDSHQSGKDIVEKDLDYPSASVQQTEARISN